MKISNSDKLLIYMFFFIISSVRRANKNLSTIYSIFKLYFNVFQMLEVSLYIDVLLVESVSLSNR